MMNRSHQFQQGHFSEFERRNPSSQSSNVDREVLDLIQRIRNCKPYLLKRLKAIEEAGQTKLLRDEVKDITYWLEIAKEVRADIIYGRDTLEVVLEKMMDMIRLHPIQGAFNSNQLQESDEEDESAPRSPSPPSGNDFDLGPRVIPMERNQDQSNDWREYLPSGSASRSNDDWTGNEYSRRGDSSRGDTDMRLEHGFTMDGRPMGRGRGLATPFRDDTRNVSLNSDSMRRNPNWSGGGSSNPYGGSDDGSRDRNIERGREIGRGGSYDYRHRSRSRSPKRNVYSSGCSPPRDRSNERNNREQYYRDQDLRNIMSHGEPMSRSVDSGRGFDYDRPPPRDIRDNTLIRDRSNESRRHEFNDKDSRENPWSNALQQQQQQRVPGLNPTSFGGNVNDVAAAIQNFNQAQPFNAASFMFSPAFMALTNLQQQQELLASQNLSGLLASQLPNMNIPNLNQNLGLLPTPLNPMGIGLPTQSNIQNIQSPHQQQLGSSNSPLGPQSPINITGINSSYGSSHSSAPSLHPPAPQARSSGLLPTPTSVRPHLNNQNNFHTTSQSHNNPFTPSSQGQQQQSQQQRPPPPSLPNRFDVRPRNTTPDPNQFRQRAQQHFARPRPAVAPHPPPPQPQTRPQNVGSNTTINPNLATNQIVSDLPLDPRRRSQLERQNQQQSHTSDSRRTQDSSSNRLSNQATVAGGNNTNTNSNSNNNRRREVVQKETHQNLKKIADRVRESISSKDKPKSSKLQELRKNFSKQAYHRLGTKGKNTIEEVQAESSERATSPDKEKEQQQTATSARSDKVTGDDRSKRQTSPPATKNSSKNREARSIKDKSPKRSDRKSNKSVDDEKRADKNKRKNKSPTKSKEKNSPTSSANTVTQKSVISFRIPKIKKPDPPPTRSSSEREMDQHDDVEVEVSDSESENIETRSVPKPSETNVSSTTTTTTTAPPAEISNETDALLRMFMAKSVGLEDNVLEHLFENPSAMEKIKSLLKDQVSKIVQDESPASPPSTTSAVPVTLNTTKTEVEADDFEVGGKRPLSPNHVVEDEEEEGTTSRSRSLPKKRASKRRSSLERLHDALREMNFDAILPLGPRRAAHTRGQNAEGGSGEQQQQQGTTATTGGSSRASQNSGTVSIVDVHGDDDEVTRDDNNTRTADDDASVAQPSQETVEKAGPKGRKRKRKGAVTVGGKKRGKKASAIGTGTAVTAAAALVAASAIPEFEVGRGSLSDSEQNSDDVEQVTTPKKTGAKRGRKGFSKETTPTTNTTASTTEETGQPPRETRSATSKKEASKKTFRSEQLTETRVLRPRVTQKQQQQPDIRINPHLNKVKLEQDYNQGVAVKLETGDREGHFEDTSEATQKEKPSEKPSTPSPPSLILSPPASPPVDFEKDTTDPVPDDKTEKSELTNDIVFDRSVFLGSSADNSDTSDQHHVPSHDKILSDAAAPLVVKRVFPMTLFGQYLEAFNENQAEQEKQLNLNKLDKTNKNSSIEISQDCKDVVDWMLNTIQFRHDQEAVALATENDELCSDDLLDGSVLNSTRNSDDDDDDDDNDDDDDDDHNEDEDDDDIEDEENVDNDVEEGSASVSVVSTELNLQNNSEPSPEKIQIKVEQNDIESLSDGVILDESRIKLEPFDTDLPIKDEKEELNGDSSNEEEGENGRTTNLEGHDLYRCGNPTCNFTSSTGATFKEHAFACSFMPANKQTQCFHCIKKLKSPASLMEHLKIHGKPRQVCSLCLFRCWVSSELTKHMKNAHRVYNCKVVRETIEGEDPIQVMYPKEVASKITQANDLTQNHMLYASKVQFRPSEMDSVPRTSIFTTLVHCGLCEYSTKVRSNILRHLKLHTIAEQDGGETKVPSKAPVNPVPCLERKELMFDKMTNWAGSSHTKKVGAVSKEDTLKLPKYIVDQFRYVCSVESCKQITGQDDILCSHMKALHFKEKFYTCPHCQEDEPTKSDPRNVVPIDKIPHHLKLHGPRLSKCGHCDYIHYSSTSMEKHVAVKHVEKKPIFYLIRDLDGDGNPMNRRASVDDTIKANERWRCNLCKAVLNSWNDALQHVQTAHKVKNQFECSLCEFGSDSIYAISTHSNSCRQGSQSKTNIMIMFLRNESFEVAETKTDDGVNIPIWRRDAPRVKHIRGIFLEDETKPSSSLSSTTNSSASKPNQSKTTPPINSATPKTSCQVLLVCPKCKLYKTKNAVDMKVHLFNELNYQRYKCTICDLQFVTIDSLKVHISNDHKSSIDLEEARAELPINGKIESQVYEIISEQLKNNEGHKSVEDKDGRNIENLLCKHCFLQFSSYHNYRTHILAKHIGSERFKCKYCNIGFWHEVMLKQHHQKSSHADKPYIVVLNNEFEARLSPGFWLEEYGIPLNKSVISGRRRKTNKREDPPKEAQVNNKYLKCSQCDFTTESAPALKTHEGQQHSSDSGGKRSPAKRRSVSISDGDKDDSFFSQSPKKTCVNAVKKSNNMSSLFRCEHCSCTFFTKRGVRRHWSKVHSADELSCRYYEVKSHTEDNLAVHDGVVLLCRYCSYETSSATYMQSHHEKEHPSVPCRFKRKKRSVDVGVGEINITVCSDCHCEFENFKKYNIHCQEKHPNSTLKHKTMKVNSSEKMEPEMADAKLLEDSVSVECPTCSQSCGSIKKYESHVQNYHSGREYKQPVLRYGRSVIIEEVEIDLRVPNKTASSSRRSSECEDIPALKKHANHHITIQQPTVLYACPKCDFKSPSIESLTNSHLVNHLLTYLCPVCSVGFRHSLDALFHLRHFHGECSLKPSSNPTAYVQFSSLKDQITKVPNPNSKEVMVINLSDEELDEEFDDSLVLSLDDSSPLRRLQPEDLIEGFDDEDF